LDTPIDSSSTPIEIVTQSYNPIYAPIQVTQSCIVVNVSHSTEVEDAIATTIASNLNTLSANTSKNHSVTYAFQDTTQIWHTSQVRLGSGQKFIGLKHIAISLTLN